MTPRKCSTCIYDALGFDNSGWKKCKYIIGTCSLGNNFQGWKPIDDDEGFDPEPYMQKPTVMEDEKEYIDFGEVK